MASAKNERRIAPRKQEKLRVDFKLLPNQEVEGILDGTGYPDLSVHALAMQRPRSGMQGVETYNLSSSGMGLTCSQPLPKGAAAALDLHLPGERTVVKMLGEVVWCSQDQDKAQAGVRIISIDYESAARVRNFLAA